MPQTFPVRRSPRLQGYDYSQEGAYFITICTHHRIHTFGEIKESECRLAQAGIIAQQDWEAITQHYPNVELDAFVVMPNHVHGIIVLVGAGLIPSASTQPKAGLLSQIMSGYKAGVTRRIHALNQSTTTVWQRSFDDHIVRNEKELNFIRNYVINNPSLWEQDRFYK